MSRLWRSTGYNRAAGTGTDTDALQTDVMRFMSILGLCLMAVFALVQSLPPQEGVPVQPDPDRLRLHEEIATQQRRAQELNAELRRLLALIEQANLTDAERNLVVGGNARRLLQLDT